MASWNKGRLNDVLQDEDNTEKDLLLNLLIYLHNKEQGKVH
jgi:hypothetical protein